MPSIVRDRRPRRLLLRAREDLRTSSSALSWPFVSLASHTLLKLPVPRGFTSSSSSEELESVIPGSSFVCSGSDGGGVGRRAVAVGVRPIGGGRGSKAGGCWTS